MDVNGVRRTSVTALAVVALAVGPAGQSSPAVSPRPQSEEYLLLGNATRGAGEPMLAVDPTDPRHIVVVAMGSVQQLHGKPATQGSTNDYHRIAKSTITWLAVTHDSGVTWDVGELPILSGNFTRCPDSFVDVTKDGVFLAGCEPRETESDPDYWGMSAMVVSRDKGRSWGPVVQIVSDYDLKRFDPSLKPVSGAFPRGSSNPVASNSPWDRPFTRIDDSTGVIYGVAQGGSAVVDEASGRRRSQAYITASTDGGKSFGPIYSWDSPAYPQSSRGISFTAAHGLLAVTYIASRTPVGADGSCPCAIFGLSRDRGRTFTYHVLKNITINQPSQGVPGARGRGGPGNEGNGGLTAISADPTRPGRFALLKSERARYTVGVSDDNGDTWSPFVVAGAVPGAVSFSKPSFEYSRDGVLGLMWRAIYEDGSYDIWASISRDGGRTFSRSLRVSHSRSPAFDFYRNAGLFGDDIQDLSMDRENMHLAWGDSRSGFQAVWYGRVRLSDFEFGF